MSVGWNPYFDNDSKTVVSKPELGFVVLLTQKLTNLGGILQVTWSSQCWPEPTYCYSESETVVVSLSFGVGGALSERWIFMVDPGGGLT
jgi:hypothetical protein